MKRCFKILLTAVVVFSTTSVFAQYKPIFKEQVGYTEWYFDELGRSITIDIGVTNPSHHIYGYFADAVLPIEFMIQFPVHEVIQLAFFGYFYNATNANSHEIYNLPTGAYKKLNLSDSPSTLMVSDWANIRNEFVTFVGYTGIEGLSLGFYLGGGVNRDGYSEAVEKDMFSSRSEDGEFSATVSSGFAFIETGFGLFANGSLFDDKLTYLAVEQTFQIKFLGTNDVFSMNTGYSNTTIKKVKNSVTKKDEFDERVVFDWMSIQYWGFIEPFIELYDYVLLFGDVKSFRLRPSLGYEAVFHIPIELSVDEDGKGAGAVKDYTAFYNTLYARPGIEIDLRPDSAHRFRVRYATSYTGGFAEYFNTSNGIKSDIVKTYTNTIGHEIRLKYSVRFPKVLRIDPEITWKIEQAFTQKQTIDNQGRLRDDKFSQVIFNTISSKLRLILDFNVVRFSCSWKPAFEVYSSENTGTVFDTNVLNLANWDIVMSFNFTPK